jgi:hypothetical protein
VQHAYGDGNHTFNDEEDILKLMDAKVEEDLAKTEAKLNKEKWSEKHDWCVRAYTASKLKSGIATKHAMMSLFDDLVEQYRNDWPDNFPTAPKYKRILTKFAEKVQCSMEAIIASPSGPKTNGNAN